MNDALLIRPLDDSDLGKPFEQDALKRSTSSKILTDLIKNSRTPFTLAIDSPWGSGKTYFLKEWAKQLREAGEQVVEFNAWQNDFNGNPLIALIEEIAEINPKENVVVGKVKKAGAILAKAAVPIAVKWLTQGVLEAKDLFSDHAEALSSDLGDVTQKLVDSGFQEYRATKNAIEEFKKALGELSSRGKGPLIFLVDELDRCRPNYAVEFLEVSKHLFDVPGIVFVLAVDSAQLAASIKGVYGSEFGGEAYLRRFFDLKYQFPVSTLSQFVEQEFRNHKLGENDVATLTFASLFELLNFDLRLQQQCIARYAVAVRLGGGEDDSHATSILTTLMHWNKEVYDQYTTGAIGAKELVKKLAKDGSFFDDMDSRFGVYLWSVLYAISGSFQKYRKEFEELVRLGEVMQVQPKKLEEAIAKRLADGNFGKLGWQGALVEEKKRVELAAHFHPAWNSPK